MISYKAAKVALGFREQRKFLLITTKSKKPDMSGAEMSIYQDLLKPINDALIAVTNMKEANRGSQVFGQLSAVSEGIMVLAWVTVENKPYKHVEECLGSAQFFGNRVLKEFKDKSVSRNARNVCLASLLIPEQGPETSRLGASLLPDIPRPRPVRQAILPQRHSLECKGPAGTRSGEGPGFYAFSASASTRWCWRSSTTASARSPTSASNQGPEGSAGTCRGSRRCILRAQQGRVCHQGP